MVDVIICGINGAMGKNLLEIIEDSSVFNIVAGIDHVDGDFDFPVFTNPMDCNVKADVLIDFSHYLMIPKLIEFIESVKIPSVICTTGLSPEVEADLVKLSKSVPIFKSGNMSLGINVMIKLAKEATKALADFDIELIEKHHNKKIDSPSGTAKMIADAIKETALDEKEYVYGRYGLDAKRNPEDLTIHSVRGGTIVGEHEVLFAGIDELIEIKHSATSKKVFAKGALTAAKFLASKEAGFYDMNDMI